VKFIISENQISNVLARIGIVQERARLFESKKDQDFSGLAKQIKRVLKDKGLEYALDFFGGKDNLVNLAYGGDFEKFALDQNIPLVELSPDKKTLTIHEYIVSKLKLKKGSLLNNQPPLGRFRYGPKSEDYVVDAYLNKIPRVTPTGDYYRIIAVGGDYGFGFFGISQKNTLGVRYREQIYKQIIDKYKLEKYLKK
jgi:hypothetical protein